MEVGKFLIEGRKSSALSASGEIPLYIAAGASLTSYTGLIVY